MTLSTNQLPAGAAAACRRLRAELAAALGDDLVAVWLHGGTTFPDRPLHPGDLDICAVTAAVTPEEREPAAWQKDPTTRPARLYAAQNAISDDSGFPFDTTYLLESETAQGEPPHDAFNRHRRLTCWAISRAHWLAGQYVHLHGLRPEELVVAPTAAELRLALDRELEHLERHVFEGDAEDPYEATYAVWNGCRILYTLETGSPVISKRSAGKWALTHLPGRWHDAIYAADRAYDGAATDGDNELLRDEMPSFVAMVRERLPITEPRPPGPPRWS